MTRKRIDRGRDQSHCSSGGAIRLWLRFDDLLLFPAILLGVFGLLWAGVRWVVRLVPVRRRTKAI